MSFLWDKIHWFNQILGVFIVLMQAVFFLATSLSNPGLPKASYELKSYESENKIYRQCQECKLWINTEERTYHCDFCGICIEGKKMKFTYKI